MADSNFTRTIGFYVFDLPNGQVLDLSSKGLVVLPDGDLSTLPRRYIEHEFYPLDSSRKIISATTENQETAKVISAVMFRKPSPADELEAILQETDSMVAELRAVAAGV